MPINSSRFCQLCCDWFVENYEQVIDCTRLVWKVFRFMSELDPASKKRIQKLCAELEELNGADLTGMSDVQCRRHITRRQKKRDELRQLLNEHREDVDSETASLTRDLLALRRGTLRGSWL